MKISALTFVFFLTLQLFAETTYDLKGSIGSYPIYMQFTDYESDNSRDNDIMGSYFYQSSLKDIVIRGDKEDNIYTLHVESGFGNITETFRLKKENEQLFVGTWKNSKGKELPIKLTSINVNSIVNKYNAIPLVTKLKQSSPYDYARSSYIVLQRDSVTSIEGKSFVWFKEKHSDTPFFRLGDGFSKVQLNTLNPILDEIHFENILNQLSCTSSWEYNNSGDNIFYNVEIGLLTKNLLGFTIFSSWFCGGAHPDFGSIGYLIDLSTGKSFDFSDIYDITVPQLYDALNSQYHFEKPVDNHEDCDYTDISVWEYFRWSITSEGVRVTPYFPRVSRNCEDSFLLPFSILEKYKKTSFSSNFMAK